MIDFDEIQRRARAASERASANLREAVEKSEALAGRIGEEPEEKLSSEEGRVEANARQQVEILGQTFSEEDMAQMAANQAQMVQMMQEQMAQAASMGADAVMSQLFGEDMGVIAAALETLSMEEDGDEEERTLGPEEEQALYTLLEDTMARLEAMPEPEPEPYGKGHRPVGAVRRPSLRHCLYPQRPPRWTAWMWRSISRSWSSRWCPLCDAPGALTVGRTCWT